MSDTCPCNWVLKHHPDIYLCGALKWAKAWLIDSDQDWQTPFLRGIEAANRDSPRVQMNSTLRADEATIMGARLIEGTAKKLIGQTFDCIRAKVEA